MLFLFYDLLEVVFNVGHYEEKASVFRHNHIHQLGRMYITGHLTQLSQYSNFAIDPFSDLDGVESVFNVFYGDKIIWLNTVSFYYLAKTTIPLNVDEDVCVSQFIPHIR